MVWHQPDAGESVGVTKITINTQSSTLPCGVQKAKGSLQEMGSTVQCAVVGSGDRQTLLMHSSTGMGAAAWLVGKMLSPLSV